MNHPEVEAKSGKAKQLFLMLHGVGSDGEDLISIANIFSPLFPDAHFISPDAPEKYDVSNLGFQWFSLRDRTPEVLLQCAQKSLKMLRTLIKKKQEELSISNADTFLIGFSQGAMMALYLTLAQEENERFGGTVAFSGRIFQPEEVSNRKTPICLVHGMQDEVIGIEEFYYCHDILKAHGIECEAHDILNLAHSIDNTALKHAVKFLKKHLENPSI